MNEQSSRSHAILQMTLRTPRGKLHGQMSFIDLAGSEKVCVAHLDVPCVVRVQEGLREALMLSRCSLVHMTFGSKHPMHILQRLRVSLLSLRENEIKFGHPGGLSPEWFLKSA